MTSVHSNLLVLTINLTAIGGIANAVAAQAVPPVSPTPVPAAAPTSDVWQLGRPTTRFPGGVYRTAFCSVLEKRINFGWTYAAPETPSTTNVKDQREEVFAVAYWPTFVLPVDDYHFCVAGKSRDGFTVIEYWTFASTAQGGVAAPSVMEQYPVGGGAPQYAWTLPSRTGVTEVLKAPSNSARGVIRGLIPSLESATQVFVYHDGSREVTRLDLVTKSETLVAAPGGAAAPLVAPTLSGCHSRFWASEYVGRGDCYFFAPVDSCAFGPMPEILALQDANKDGVPESVVVISGADWEAQGWSNEANVLRPTY
ncbi:MAG: hypothetical protein HZA52_18785 [Planctomycetes bacterium]|nr:hypothetical protein [Planctomycetota bacterium]